jgi:hypothetical protein
VRQLVQRDGFIAGEVVIWAQEKIQGFTEQEGGLVAGAPGGRVSFVAVDDDDIVVDEQFGASGHGVVDVAGDDVHPDS